MENLRGWSLEIAGTSYCAEALSSIPWVTLKTLAEEKTKLTHLRRQELEQKSLVWTQEQEILKTIHYGEVQTKIGICLSVRV
tara:strand:- start:60 stop:305 length:246 start_codon:yes stop_codon:yes gene_type:complete